MFSNRKCYLHVDHYIILFNCILLLLLLLPNVVLGSNGDRSTTFYHCIQNCDRQNCTADGIHFQEQAQKYYRQTFWDRLLQWNCADECQYGCMWWTVEVFRARKLSIPQFYGKWPFIRFLGLQEPASVLFSLMNLFAHIHHLRRFRKLVSPKSPCFKLWHIFSMVNMNGWIWSTVFHARDYPVTELLDYTFAYAIVLTSFYTFLMRILYNYSMIWRGSITVAFLSFYINYFLYLSVGRFSYSYNIKTNLITGLLGGLGWMSWALAVRRHRPCSFKILYFYVFCALAMSLELLDFSPIFWTFDAHSLWHLSTAILTPTLYNFAIDDCQQLYKEQQFQQQQQQQQQLNTPLGRRGPGTVSIYHQKLQ